MAEIFFASTAFNKSSIVWETFVGITEFRRITGFAFISGLYSSIVMRLNGFASGLLDNIPGSADTDGVTGSVPGISAKSIPLNISIGSGAGADTGAPGPGATAGAPGPGATAGAPGPGATAGAPGPGAATGASADTFSFMPKRVATSSAVSPLTFFISICALGNIASNTLLCSPAAIWSGVLPFIS